MLFEFRRLILLSIAIVMVGVHGTASTAERLVLAPYKDDLFAYPKVLESRFGGRFLKLDYNKQRDIYGRDTIPLRKAKQKYVNAKPRWSKGISSFKFGGEKIKFSYVGPLKGGATITVLYLHGQGGNRFQGVNDWTFGGNFNRLQNLMVRNGGLLLAPDFSDFKAQGSKEIATFLSLFKARSPAAPLIVACGSMGGALCWRLVKKREIAKKISGLFLLGSLWDDTVLKAKFLRDRKHRIPIYFGQGSWDTVFPWKRQFEMFNDIRRVSPQTPVRFVLFETGKHGTPIRMVDWRRELNWMLANAK